MAVANITELSNSVNPTNVVSDVMSPALVKSTCMMNLMHTEGLPAGTMTKLHGKKGSLTAAALAESTALAVNSNGELTDTSVTSTIAKVAVSSGISVEQLKFGNIDDVRIVEEQGAAIARYVDNDALSLFTGLSTVVTSTSIMTLDDIMLGQYNIFNSECPNKEVPLAVVLSHKGHYNIKKEIIQSGASAFTNPAFLEILGGKPQANCYVGSMPGLDFYATSGHQTSGGDTAQGIIHPLWCLGGNFAPAPETWSVKKGSEGIYEEHITFFFYDCYEYNDLCGVELLSDT
jgi:hypothetical protein